jgi:hypothetical protein
LAEARQAISAGAPLNDIAATGSATWILGGTNVSGAVSIKAKGIGESRLDFSMSDSPLSEVRNDTSGEWVDSDGKSHALAQHNCWSPAPWFSPISLLNWASQPDAAESYVGAEQRNGIAVDHIKVTRSFGAQTATLATDIQRLTTLHLYLDSSSHLPLFASFNNHPDNDSSRDVPVEIRFSDYRSISGIKIPFRVQRLLQGNLNLDLSLSSVMVNSGVSDSEFTVQ